MSKVLNLIKALSANPATDDVTAAGSPAQFDADTSLVTALFLKNRGLQSRNVFSGNATATLTAAQIGGTYWVGGTTTGITIILPLIAGVPDGARIQIVNTNLNSVTVARQGTNLLFHGNAGPVPTITMMPGDTLIVEVYSATGWMVVGGSALLPKSSQFLANIAVNGSQRLPSGLIMKWATLTTTAGAVTWTFAEPFPTALLSVSAIPAGGNYTCCYTSVSQTGVVFNVYNASTAALATAVQLRPFAIGY